MPSVISYVSATARVGNREGNGECWTLAENALRQAGMKTSNDLCRVVPGADYIWGRRISMQEAQAGDIIQFRTHRITTDTETTTTAPDGSTSTRTFSDPDNRDHHTAIVESGIDQNGVIAVIEQNARNCRRTVKRNSLLFDPMKPQETTVTNGNVTVITRITVSNINVVFYRPIPN